MVRVVVALAFLFSVLVSLVNAGTNPARKIKIVNYSGAVVEIYWVNVSGCFGEFIVQNLNLFRANF